MKKLFALVMTLLLITGLSACSSSNTNANTTPSSTDTPSVSDTSTMNIELTTAPVGTHPLKTNDSPSTFVTNQLFETLYRRSLDGTTYEPLLAAELPTYSDDGLTATIKLRENVTFGDGTAFTSESVGYMIDSLKDESYGSQRPSIVESIESYECTDDNTIVLHLAYNDGVLLAKLAHTNGAIVNPELDKTKDLMVDPTGAGTGAYEFVSAVSGSTYTLKAKDNYWGGEVEVKNVVYSVVGDEATAVARLQTGEADFYPTVSVDSYETVAAIDGITAVDQASSAIGYLSLRSKETTAKNPLMANKEFRTALLQGIDTETYVSSIMGSQGTALKSIVAPSLVGYVAEMEDSYISYDKEAAKATIDANGWANQTVTLLVSTREAQQTLAAYIQAQLAEIGINVEVVSEEWSSFLSDAKNDGNYDFTVLTWSNVTGDGQQMLDPNFSTKNGIRVKYDNAEFDSYVDASARTTDLSERQANMLKAVELIQSDAIVKSIYVQNTLFAYNSTKFNNVVMDMGATFRVVDFKVNK